MLHSHQIKFGTDWLPTSSRLASDTLQELQFFVPKTVIISILEHIAYSESHVSIVIMYGHGDKNPRISK